MAFKIREQVVCIKKGTWAIVDGGIRGGVSDPIYNEIYTISGFLDFKNEIYFYIKELDYFGCWFSGNFRKLDYNFVDEVLEMIMDEQLIKIESC